MDIRVSPIGNSKGFRVPKAILTQLGFSEEAEMQIVNGGLLFTPKAVATTIPPHPRAGWAEDFARLAAEGSEDEFADWREIPNDFDAEEWV